MRRAYCLTWAAVGLIAASAAVGVSTAVVARDAGAKEVKSPADSDLALLQEGRFGSNDSRWPAIQKVLDTADPSIRLSQRKGIILIGKGPEYYRKQITADELRNYCQHLRFKRLALVMLEKDDDGSHGAALDVLEQSDFKAIVIQQANARFYLIRRVICGKAKR